MRGQPTVLHKYQSEACRSHLPYKVDIIMTQRVTGQWAVYYTSPQSLKLMFSYSLKTLLNSDWLVYQVECSNVSTTNSKKG